MLADDPTGAAAAAPGTMIHHEEEHESTVMAATPTNPPPGAPSPFTPRHDPAATGVTSPATLDHSLGDSNIVDPDLLEAATAGYPFHSSEEGTAAAAADTTENSNRKRRICRFPKCSRVIKSQGHCQRHGAAVKRCKVDGCDKQVQGTYQGMCKRHWREATNPATTTTTNPPAAPAAPPPPTGPSVYDSILPQSITYKPIPLASNTTATTTTTTPSIQQFEPGAPVMPLVVWLRNNAHKAFGWHRKEERLSRGCFPLSSPAARLENWERQLVLVEILLLSGGTPYANFRDLAHAWGREKNFHTTLAISVFERRGDLERKRRSDAGKPRAKRNKQQQDTTTSTAASATTMGSNHHDMSPAALETLHA